MFTAVVQHFSVNVDFRVILVLLQELLGLIERLLEGIRVSPCEESNILFRIEVIETVREGDREVTFQDLPPETAHATFPLHRVGRHAENRAKAHLVELTLLGHAFDRESECVAVLDSSYTEVEPSSIVTNGCVRHSVTGKPAVKEL